MNILQIINWTLNFVPILNKIEECLIAPRFAFAKIFQLKGYGQYGMHTNLDLVQSILLRLSDDDSSIVVFLKRKL